MTIYKGRSIVVTAFFFQQLALLKLKRGGRKMAIEEITVEKLNAERFIESKIREISEAVVGGLAINALSGGVDSATVTALGHRALGERLITVFIDNGLMREGEPEEVVSSFRRLGISVQLVRAQEEFFKALRGITDPEAKREAIAQTFYREVLAQSIRKSKAKYLLQGTILTDVDEALAKIKRHHNVFVQLGIDPQKEFGYRIIEPLVQLRKPGVREVAEALGLPTHIYKRMPFPGPALATRIIGEITPEEVRIVRKATSLTEGMLAYTQAFQCLAILHRDKVTGVRDNERVFGRQIEIRCWDSVDARTATPTEMSWSTLTLLAKRITTEIPEVVSVTYNITSKPPSTMEPI